MAVSPSYKAFVLEQLSAVAPVSARAMFGGVGIYAEGFFFALIDDDRLFFKVDDATRPRFVEAGMGAFDPYKDGTAVMGGYYELPGDVLEDEDRLPGWMREAIAVAARAPRKRAAKKTGSPRAKR